MGIADYPETVTPTPEDSLLACEAGRALSRLLGQPGNGKEAAGVSNIGIKFPADGDHPAEELVSIPSAAFRLLVNILNQMALGNAVTLIPIHAELTTQEAADVLNVSRPFVIQLIEQGDLPHHKVGTHRRVRFSDLMEYKKRIDASRLEALAELQKQAQDLKMGY